MRSLYNYWNKVFAGTRSVRAKLRYDRWMSLYKVIHKYNVSSVLEFGSGISTLLFDRNQLEVDSYETDKAYMDQVKDLCSDFIRFHHWNNKDINIGRSYDLALVDGEVPRNHQLKLAMAHANIVAVDDYKGSSLFDKWKRIDDGSTKLAIFKKSAVREWPTVSVIISHNNDFPMLGITVKSVLEELRYVNGGGEIVICDNSSEDSDLVYNVINKSYIDKGLVKIVRQDFPSLATARNRSAGESSSKYLLSLDSHMILGRDMIADLVNFADCYTDDDLGFVHAPLALVHQSEELKRHEFKIRTYYREPSPVGLKGMPWLCKKSFWDYIKGYGFISDHAMAWGGGEVYMAIKPWVLGFTNYGIPCRPGFHIGPYRNMSKYVRYRRWKNSGNYGLYFSLVVASYIFGETKLPNRITNLSYYGTKGYDMSHWDAAVKLGENEKKWLESIQVRSIDSYFEKFPHLAHVKEADNERV